MSRLSKALNMVEIVNQVDRCSRFGIGCRYNTNACVCVCVCVCV